MQFTLSNGLSVVLIEDHEVPTVKGQLLMRGGQRASPSDKVGMCTTHAAKYKCYICALTHCARHAGNQHHSHSSDWWHARVSA